LEERSEGKMAGLDIWWVSSLFGVIFVLIAYSFWFKRTVLFRFASTVYVSVTVGYSGAILTNALLDTAISPIAGGQIMLIIPTIMGLLFFTRLSRQHSYLARLPVAICAGVGLSIQVYGAIASDIIRQVNAMLKPFGTDPSILLVLILFVSTLYYFLFHRRFRDIPAAEAFGTLGRVGIMIMFGTALGNTAITSMSALIANVTTVVRFFGL
jgi:hypothetical protein